MVEVVEDLFVEESEDEEGDVALLLWLVEVGRSRSGRRSWRMVVAGEAEE